MHAKSHTLRDDTSRFSKEYPRCATRNREEEFVGCTAEVEVGLVELGPLPTAATDRPRKRKLTWNQKFAKLIYEHLTAENKPNAKNI